MNVEYTEEDIIEELIATNHFIDEGDSFKLLYKYVNKRTKLWNYVLEVSGKTLSKVANRYVMLNYKSRYVKEYISVIQCFKCQKYHHTSTKCKSEEVCGICADKHATLTCKKTTNLKCINCIRANEHGAGFPTDHKAGAQNCTIHVAKLKAEKERINYQ